MKVVSLLALCLASAALVACGSSSGTTSETPTASETSEAPGAAANQSEGEEGAEGGGGSTVSLEADPGGQITYTSTTATAAAGKVTIAFKNPQALSHDVAIESSSGEMIAKTELVAEGSTSTSTELKPGQYTYYCTVPGHREAGMEGTLTVK